MHHLDSAAGEPEGHRPERTGTRPVEQLVSAGDYKPAIGDFVTHRFENCVLLRARANWRGRARIDHSHSSAPFFHS